MALRALHTYYHLRAFAATSLRVATCNASPEAFVTFRTSRPFHTSFLTLAEDNKDSETVAAAVADVKSDTTLEASDAATEPPKTSRRRRRFMEWMNGEGAKFKKPAMALPHESALFPEPARYGLPPRADLRELHVRFSVTDATNAGRKIQTVDSAHRGDPEAEGTREGAGGTGVL
ncbi:hypothetical protein BC938DRAFT_483839 [Jimgerdemannia flammicorona]|uniref:Uncharacterized protein n=1 Tax=Jimgerdemannia flammicorona TaxID=994334 RepID=A0A433QB60_9FUNG|nr:hypothetical protein BC938DRAFT_483839 [Jimgerdemannia flammicorona]